jgi:rare lipoprotein A
VIRKFFFSILTFIVINLLLGCAQSGRYADKYDSAPTRPPTATELQDPEVKHDPVGRGNLPYIVFGQHYTPMTERMPFKQTGVASWYGKKFHGHLTSNGEVYNMFGMSAAHKTLPLPSYVKVTNLANNKSAIVRVNDRGPFHEDRIIDLSYSAAYKIGVYNTGTAKVKVEVLLPSEAEAIKPNLVNNSRYNVTIDGFNNEAEAEETLKGLSIMLDSTATLDASIAEPKLVFGPFNDKKQADQMLEKIKQFGYDSVNIEPVLTP